MKISILLFFMVFGLSSNLCGQTEAEKQFPCRYAEKYKPLDFWIGEWDVFVKDKKTATSSITKSEGGCTLHEDYKTLSEFYGRSVNYLDPSDETYTQIWIDKFNNVITFKAVEAKDGFLKFQTDNGKGTLTIMHYTLDKSNGNVTQVMESSKDGGKTWTKSFEGVYKKRNT